MDASALDASALVNTFNAAARMRATAGLMRRVMF